MRRIATTLLILLASMPFLSCDAAPAGQDSPIPVRPGWASDPRFADGLAEVQVYDAIVVREGAERAVRAFTVLVAEDLDADRLVKADDWTRDGLMRAQKFGLYFTARTGFAEFHEAFNVFLDTASWHPRKLVYSAQDWCGLTLKSWIPEGDDAVLRWTGYWEQDGGRGERRLPGGGGAIPSDALPAWVRGLELRDDTAFDLELLPTLQGTRVGNPAVVDARLEVVGSASVEVPAGTFDVRQVRVRHANGEVLLAVEGAFPHRTISWTDELGQSFRLVKSVRESYWTRVDDGDERDLEP